MPNSEEIANTIKELERMYDAILLFKKQEQGEGRNFPIIHLEGTGHWLDVDASLFCINNALQVLNKRLDFHRQRLDGGEIVSIPSDSPRSPKTLYEVFVGKGVANATV